MTGDEGVFKDLQTRSVIIGEVRWDRTSRRLTVRGEQAKLTWRAAAALSLLVEARGGVVTREEFERHVWGDAHMDYSAVSQCIKTLRRILDPAPGGSSYIETVARAGYRLAVEVIEEPEPAPADPNYKVPAAAPQRRGWGRWLAVGTGVVLILLAGLFLYQSARNRQQAGALAERGFQLMRRGTTNSGSQATVLFREALALIPNYPPATAGMAEAASRLGTDSFDHALDLARRAVAADPNCSECQSVLGQILGVRMWRWEEAGRHLQRAVELNPKRATHRVYLTEWLMVQGRTDEAARHAEESTRLDPSNSRCWTILAAVRYFQQRYADSVREAERSASLDPQHPSAPIWGYHSYMLLGEEQNAVMGRAKALAAYSTDPIRTYNDYAGKFYAALSKAGRRGLVQVWLEDVSKGRALDVHRYNRALWFTWIGEYDSALAELEAGVKSRPYQMIWTAADPAFIPLRTNPRFRKVVRELGLPLFGAS
jgi:DNA-binding winged helix-turn-helix (wHTH) protein/tetratricopeptide (TPR) repeat protein